MPFARLSVAIVSFIAAFAHAAPSTATASDDLITPEETKATLARWTKACEHADGNACVPPGVDLVAKTVVVTDKDRDERRRDIAKLEGQKEADLDLGGQWYALYVHHCKPSPPLHIKADLSLYKVVPGHVWDVMNAVLEKIASACQEPGDDNSYADRRWVNQVRTLYIKNVPTRGDDYPTYTLDKKSGTLTVGIFTSGVPMTMDPAWYKLLHHGS